MILPLRVDVYTNICMSLCGTSVATGVAPQPMGAGGKPGPYDAAVGNWVRRYRYYGHFLETAVQTLHWDTACCHDGYGPAGGPAGGGGACSADSTWAPCQDVVATALVGGTIKSPAAGNVVCVALPQGTTVLCFSSDRTHFGHY